MLLPADVTFLGKNASAGVIRSGWNYTGGNTAEEGDLDAEIQEKMAMEMEAELRKKQL